ncbi:leucine-rich repeat domain-containing protein [Leyella stercorea]|uniref:leucine-rich repeat domain-containing protein n=1 Tax=Leyella stercorea TaxID=363265 RepID=UPI002432A0AC|nr:leucine-rich repeat domain-containing protein [Leyella stercorea]
MKRVYFTLALMSLFGGLNAFAQSYTTIDGVKYGLMKDGQCVVIGDDGAKGDITFENEVEIDGIKYPVTAVCGLGNYPSEATDQKKGFSENTNITGITFEEGSQIKWIGDHAFKNCSSLKTINNVPAGLTDINEWCFEGTALETVDLSNTNVTIMKDGVFSNNKSLTSIQLPNKLENFWDNAFNGCTALNNIVMPSTVKAIYNYVFENCTSLSNITLNEGCTTLGNHVFKNCPLAAVTFPKTLGSIDEWAFEGTKLETVDLSNTQIKKLPNGSFYNCQQLNDVKLPIELTDIGECAFYKSAIASITFPSSLQKIDAWAFQYTQLTNVVIPTKTGHIGDGAFSDNANLTTVVVNGLECYLAVSAFANCPTLTDVYITSNNEPVAGRYGYPFQNDPTVHVVSNYLETFKGLRNDKNENPCNTTNFDSKFSLTLGKEWTTLTSAYNLDFSDVEGLTAYTAKYNKANDAVALTPVKKVKAHTGLILKGEAGKTYTLPILASNEEGLDEATDNQLVDCVDAVWSTGRDNDYFLSNGKFVKSKNNGWALPGKSYLYINGGRGNGSNSPLRVYIDNTATAINGITNNPVVKDEAYYNLQGVKVQRPQHGVFIHNGKKVVLK